MPVFKLIPSIQGLTCAILAMAATSCAHDVINEQSEREVAEAQAKDAAYLREHYTAQEFPENPRYAEVTKQCIFFVADPKGEMIPIGILQKGATIVVRDTDGQWTDIQLASGHPGSVIANNLVILDDGEFLDFEGPDALLPLPESSYRIDNSLFAPTDL